ncbi:hypothetical protein AF72_09345 [Xylella taiwanensis]|uniref:Uncharacterized protein n=1 Tax=Xylella taiwanensis TaxID=1444770 RepID=Z9JHT1_9GAMM|nr:hypothetical protein AB672_10215 [Xylella taiwanensis]EWS77744.1 hypothetical protein AF72_09345 [Xylella taiwanensis]
MICKDVHGEEAWKAVYGIADSRAVFFELRLCPLDEDGLHCNIALITAEMVKQFNFDCGVIDVNAMYCVRCPITRNSVFN